MDCFYQAEDFYKNIKNQKHWSKTLFVSNSYDAYRWLKNQVKPKDYLFIDSDYGLRKSLWLSSIKSRNIYVYEEGIAIYWNDLLKTGPQNHLIQFFLKLLGVKEYLGGGIYTKGIIIYDIEKHKRLIREFRKERIQFKRSFLEHLTAYQIDNNFNLGNTKIIIDRIKTKKVFIYIIGFDYDAEVDLMLEEYPDYVKILKPHPNQKESVNKSQYDFIIDNDVLVELFIIESLKVFDEIIVVHQDSSALEYFNKIENLTSINIMDKWRSHKAKSI